MKNIIISIFLLLSVGVSAQDELQFITIEKGKVTNEFKDFEGLDGFIKKMEGEDYKGKIYALSEIPYEALKFNPPPPPEGLDDEPEPNPDENGNNGNGNNNNNNNNNNGSPDDIKLKLIQQWSKLSFSKIKSSHNVSSSKDGNEPLLTIAGRFEVTTKQEGSNRNKKEDDLIREILAAMNLVK